MLRLHHEPETPVPCLIRVAGIPNAKQLGACESNVGGYYERATGNDQLRRGIRTSPGSLLRRLPVLFHSAIDSYRLFEHSKITAGFHAHPWPWAPRGCASGVVGVPDSPFPRSICNLWFRSVRLGKEGGGSSSIHRVGSRGDGDRQGTRSDYSTEATMMMAVS